MNDLRQVGDLRRGAELDAALVGVLLAHDHLDERGFSRAVVADERDALAAGDLEVHAGEQRPLAEGLADTLERQHLVAEKFAAPELRGHLLLARGLVRRAHPLDALFHRKRALV